MPLIFFSDSYNVEPDVIKIHSLLVLLRKNEAIKIMIKKNDRLYK